MVEQLTAIDEVHNQIQVLVVLESKLQLHYEGVVQLHQDVSLSYTRINTF